MEEVAEVQKPISEILEDDAFYVHDMMFNVGDIIQCTFLMNYSLYEHHHSDGCDGYIININTGASSVMATPFFMNTSLNSLRKKNDPTNPSLQKVYGSLNTCTIKNGNYMVYVSKGYITDTFKVRDSESDFTIEGTTPFVAFTASDIESLTNPDPILL